MSGRQAKRRRSVTGISIRARREEADFARLVLAAELRRGEDNARGRALRRRALAVVGLVLVGLALGLLTVGAW